MINPNSRYIITRGNKKSIIVRTGDTLSTIAAEFCPHGLTAKDLWGMNQLTIERHQQMNNDAEYKRKGYSDTIYPGMELTVNRVQESKPFKISKGEWDKKTAQKTQTTHPSDGLMDGLLTVYNVQSMVLMSKKEAAAKERAKELHDAFQETLKGIDTAEPMSVGFATGKYINVPRDVVWACKKVNDFTLNNNVGLYVTVNAVCRRLKDQ